MLIGLKTFYGMIQLSWMNCPFLGISSMPLLGNPETFATAVGFRYHIMQPVGTLTLTNAKKSGRSVRKDENDKKYMWPIKSPIK